MGFLSRRSDIVNTARSKRLIGYEVQRNLEVAPLGAGHFFSWLSEVHGACASPFRACLNECELGSESCGGGGEIFGSSWSLCVAALFGILAKVRLHASGT